MPAKKKAEPKKKATAKKKAVARKSKSKALMSPKDMENYYKSKADAQAGRLPTVEGNKVSIKGGEFTYRGADLGDEMDVVILDFVFENVWYNAPFDPDTPRTPACAAIAEEQDLLSAFEDAAERQADTCDECPLNVFGSAERGKGKECKNNIRIALMSVEDLESDPTNVEIVRIDIPPTSLKNFKKYAKGINKVHHRPIEGVVTTIGFDEDADYEVLTFKAKNKIERPEHAELIEAKIDEAHELIMQGYDFSQYEPYKKPATKKKGTAKKKGKFGKR